MTPGRAFTIAAAGVVGAVVGLAAAAVGFCLFLDALFNVGRRRRHEFDDVRDRLGAY